MLAPSRRRDRGERFGTDRGIRTPVRGSVCGSSRMSRATTSPRPPFTEDLIIVGGLAVEGNLAIRRGGTGVLGPSSLAWKAGSASNFASPFLYRDCVYWVNAAGVARCLARNRARSGGPIGFPPRPGPRRSATRTTCISSRRKGDPGDPRLRRSAGGGRHEPPFGGRPGLPDSPWWTMPSSSARGNRGDPGRPADGVALRRARRWPRLKANTHAGERVPHEDHRRFAR